MKELVETIWTMPAEDLLKIVGIGASVVIALYVGIARLMLRRIQKDQNEFRRKYGI